MVVEGLGGSTDAIILGPTADITGLRHDVLTAFRALAQDYYATTGKTVYVNSAYRSPEEQSRLHNEDPSRAAAPGRSMHNYGLAIDLNSSTATEMRHSGLLDKHGFWRPLMRAHVRVKEPWHIEPKGLKYDVVRAAGYIPRVAGGGAFLLFLTAMIVISHKPRGGK